MAHISDYLSPADLQKISNLQVLARLVVEGFISGLHRSSHKGLSVEFAQLRQYVQGDEIRRLDWKVFAKTDRLYVREYEEETNLRCTMLLDLSGSMGYGGEKSPSKHQYALRLAASLAYLLLQQRDSVGLVTFDTGIRRYIPPRSNMRHLRVLLEDLATATPGGETDLGEVLHSLVPRLHRRGLIVLFSDCFGDVRALTSALAQFRSARHEVLVFHILDRDEVEFPFREWTRFESLEETQSFRLVDPAQFRAAYLENLRRFQEELVAGCRKHRVDLVPMLTDQPCAEALAQYLTRRTRRPQ